MIQARSTFPHHEELVGTKKSPPGGQVEESLGITVQSLDASNITVEVEACQVAREFREGFCMANTSFETNRATSGFSDFISILSRFALSISFIVFFSPFQELHPSHLPS